LSLKLNPKAVITSLAKGFAPDFISGVLEEEARGKTVEQFYQYIEAGIWDNIPLGQRQFILNQKPWDLDWLTINFIIEAIAASNQKIACLIISSPDLQENIKAEIDQIKQRLS
jgi:hypothetical protein